MFRRLRLFLNARSSSSRRLVHARTIRFVPPGNLETLHEVAVYLHRFHNLDLFQQGWYQIKISMRWEDGGRETIATPARVVQYEGLVSDEILGVWTINDTDHSFSTQPFRIKYARQDVLLSVMISFSVPLGKDEIPSTSAVILKFELTHTPIGENGTEMQAGLDTNPAAVHEFRIPPKALLGLHSYCPVHFDAYHAVLVDLSVHTVFIKAGAYTPSQKVTSNLPDGELLPYKYEGSDKDTAGPNLVELVKALSTSRDILLKELQKISNAIGQTIDDVSESSFDFGTIDLTFGTESSRVNGDRSGSGDFLGNLKLSNGLADHGSDTLLSYSSSEELLSRFNFLGGQLSLLWNTFLKFHRKNKSKILEYLHGTWCGDRKAEWSIWMVHSKADIPHRYLKSGVDESFYDGVLGKPSLPRKLNVDPVQLATTRAELHRKSIAQMNINNHSIQDMHLYGDPSRIPVVILEKQVMENPVLASSHKLSLDSLDQKNIPATQTALGNKGLPKLLGCELQKGGRVLKVVVFVHGFQGHHLDLRLIRNQWLLIDPGAECLMSEANQEKTSGDFREMGGRLADEVSAFLRKKLDKASRSGGCRDIRLSFVGHSIGNVIIRSALTESVMEPYLRYLYTYMSLSGPHLGYWYSSNSLFNSGLWILKKLKGDQCIHQLTFSDAPDLQNTFFYKLCQQKTLEYFRSTILLSSPQDGYVPYHSARIELCPASSSDNSKKAQVFMEMLNNCLDQIRAPSSQQRTFMRCDVNFDMSSQGRSLNTIIGRAAHIEFLETDNYAKFIMWSYPDLFQ